MVAASSGYNSVRLSGWESFVILKWLPIVICTLLGASGVQLSVCRPPQSYQAQDTVCFQTVWLSHIYQHRAVPFSMDTILNAHIVGVGVVGHPIPSHNSVARKVFAFSELNFN